MIRQLSLISLRHWTVLALVGILPVLIIISHKSQAISPSFVQYIAEPILATALAGLSYMLLGQVRVRVRHSGEKALLVAAIVCIWFVVYFLSGLLLTYVRNSLVVNPLATLLNIAVYCTSAAALEYVRYKLMSSISRRHVLWFGAIVSIVLASTQLPYGQISAATSTEDLIKVFIASIVPEVALSFVLTYLALTSGLVPMMVLRLGVVMVAIVPPIIPNFDWYLIGISSLILSLAVYIIVDGQLQQQDSHRHKKIQHLKRANDVMYIILLCGLAAFMTGVFSYRPTAILSNSMQPIYGRGSIVVVERVTDTMDIKVGDIVQYELAGKTITHRVVTVDAASDGSGKRVFTTKGDNSPSVDPIVSSNQIVGVVKAYIPYIGYPTVWLREMAR